MAEGSTIRTFLAIDPPEAVRDAIGRIQDRLKRNVDGMIRWTAPTSIHLTLKFFGDITPEDVTQISAAVEGDIAGMPPLTLEIKTLGVFPDTRRPRIIWLGTTGETHRLQEIQKRLDRAFGKLGFPEEDRPFRPHWTLGRIKSPTGLTGLPRALEAGTETTAGSFTVQALTLFKSDLTPRGPVYRKLAEYPLQG